MNYQRPVLDVAPHLPPEFMTAKMIWARVGLWAPTTVRNALDVLVDQGTAVRVSELNAHGCVRHLYRRASPFDQCGKAERIAA